jgi:hypothetical protein
MSPGVRARSCLSRRALRARRSDDRGVTEEWCRGVTPHYMIKGPVRMYNHGRTKPCHPSEGLPPTSEPKVSSRIRSARVPNFQMSGTATRSFLPNPALRSQRLCQANPQMRELNTIGSAVRIQILILGYSPGKRRSREQWLLPSEPGSYRRVPAAPRDSWEDSRNGMRVLRLKLLSQGRYRG